jgi:hypothetical protein
MPEVVGWKLETLECIQKTICVKLDLKIRGVDFVASLILLGSKGIDVTLEIGLVKQA